MNTFQTELLTVLGRIATAFERIAAQPTANGVRKSEDQCRAKIIAQEQARNQRIPVQDLMRGHGREDGHPMGERTFKAHCLDANVHPEDGTVTRVEADRLIEQFKAARQRPNARRLAKRRRGKPRL